MKKRSCMECGLEVCCMYCIESTNRRKGLFAHDANTSATITTTVTGEHQQALHVQSSVLVLLIQCADTVYWVLVRILSMAMRGQANQLPDKLSYMDQIHARAQEALQPFIHLANANSATSPRFVANIISNATSSPQTYVFAELLETPTVQSLRSKDTPEEYQGHLTLLEIYAWGTWKDYQTTPNLPQLNQDQTLKLRLLSLLSLAPTLKPLTYDSLMDALSISTPSELESLVTTAIYSSLITARLSPASNPPTVNVTSVAPLRDVKPQSLSTMITLLTEWETRCGDVVSDLEAEIERIKTDAAKRQTREAARARLLEQAITDVSSGEATQSRQSGFPSQQQQPRGKRLGSGSASSGNKREFTADDNDEDDDGYFETGNGGGVDSSATGASSRMDIDESGGSSSASRSGLAAAGARQAKRMLGKKS